MVKKNGAVPHFPLCIHGMHKDNFTITFTYFYTRSDFVSFFFLKEDGLFIQCVYITLNKNLIEEDRLYLKYFLFMNR